MRPTNRFRWVPRGECALGETEHGDAVFGFKNVLQQWWEITGVPAMWSEKRTLRGGTVTPLQIHILLHYAGRIGDYGDADKNWNAPAVVESLEWLTQTGLLQRTPPLPPGDANYQPKYEITDRGRAYVEEGLCKVPFPIQETRWRIPWGEE